MRIPPLHRIADVILILTCLGVGGAAGARWYSSAPAPSATRALYSKGDALPSAPGLDLHLAKRTLLIFLSTRCKYCDQSAQFYSRLSAQRASRDLRIVAVGLQPISELRAYLSARSVEVDSVVRAQPGLYRVSATPTIVLTDSSAKVVDVWAGRLGDRETEVEAAIGR